MLLNGHPHGVDDLDAYEAACVAWAYLDEISLLHPDTANIEGPQQLRHMILQTQTAAMDDLAAMNAEMGLDPISAASLSRPDPRAELAEMEALLSGDSGGS